MVILGLYKVFGNKLKDCYYFIKNRCVDDLKLVKGFVVLIGGKVENIFVDVFIVFVYVGIGMM